MRISYFDESKKTFEKNNFNSLKKELAVQASQKPIERNEFTEWTAMEKHEYWKKEKEAFLSYYIEPQKQKVDNEKVELKMVD